MTTRRAILIPPDIRRDVNYHDYPVVIPDDEGNPITIYIYAEEGELYPGKVVVIEKTDRRVAGYNKPNSLNIKYWEIVKNGSE